MKADPRLEVTNSSLDQKYAALKTLEGYSQLAADATKQLVESKEIAEAFEKELSGLSKENTKMPLKLLRKL